MPAPQRPAWTLKSLIGIAATGTLISIAADARTPGREALDAHQQSLRGCLTRPARDLLARIEEAHGAVQVVSTCRPGATIAGTGRPSRHASGNAIDFDAGVRKGDIIRWLIANHHGGGIMTYPGMDHIHVDVGPRFVSLAGRDRSLAGSADFERTRMSLGANRDALLLWD